MMWQAIYLTHPECPENWFKSAKPEVASERRSLITSNTNKEVRMPKPVNTLKLALFRCRQWHAAKRACYDGHEIFYDEGFVVLSPIQIGRSRVLRRAPDGSPYFEEFHAKARHSLTHLWDHIVFWLFPCLSHYSCSQCRLGLATPRTMRLAGSSTTLKTGSASALRCSSCWKCRRAGGRRCCTQSTCTTFPKLRRRRHVAVCVRVCVCTPVCVRVRVFC